MSPSFIHWPLPSPCVSQPECLAVVYIICIRFDAERVHIVRCTLKYS